MKNFFTKAFVCAGILASTLALSSVATFAATYTYGAKDTSVEGTISWDFTTNTPSSNDEVTEASDVQDILITATGTKTQFTSSNGLSMKGTTIKVPVPAGSISGLITTTGIGNNRYLYLATSGSARYLDGYCTTLSYSSSDVQDGYLTFVAHTDEVKLKTITVTNKTEVAVSSATTSKVYDLTSGLTAGDNNNGLYAFEAMSYGSDNYIAGSNNPTIESNGVANAGTAIKFTAGTDGTLTIVWKQSSSNSKYGRCVEVLNGLATQKYNVACSESDETATISVKSGGTYYFYGYGGTKNQNKKHSL